MKSAHPVKTLRSFRSRSTSCTGHSRCLERPLCAMSGRSITTLCANCLNPPFVILRKAKRSSPDFVRLGFEGSNRGLATTKTDIR
jgi:hypothetical protein